MAEKLKIILQWIKKSKAYIATTFAAVFIFTFLLFPFSDLNDLVSAQIAKLTQNQIYIQFENMGISILSGLGIKFTNVHVDTNGFPAIKSEEVAISPSISSLITNKPGGSVTAKGFLNGNVEISLKGASKSESGLDRNEISIEAQKISLSELRELFNLPVHIKGDLDLNSKATADLTFTEQPDLDLTLKIEKFELPPSTVNTMMGPLTVPDFKLASVELKGRLSQGKFNIEKGTIGKSGDEIQGTIKGNLGLQIVNQGRSFTTQMGGYSFDLDLQIKNSFNERAKFFMSFLENYKTPTPQGARYTLKVSAPNTQSPPNFGAAK